MCLAFYAGCRWSDAAFLRLSNLKFDSEGVAITIPKSKTDQLGRGETVYVQHADSPYCPVILLQDYIAKLCYGERDGYPLIMVPSLEFGTPLCLFLRL